MIKPSDNAIDFGTISAMIPAGEYTIEEVGFAAIDDHQFQESESKKTVTVHTAAAADAAEIGELINYYSNPRFCLSVTKQWLQDSDSDRPAKVTVKLYRYHYAGNDTSAEKIYDTDANGKIALRTVYLNRANNWTYVVTGMPQKTSAGEWYHYEWVEEVPDGYVQIGNDVVLVTSCA